MDEADTDQRLITYFLQTLGWDDSGDIEPDYPVSIGAYSIDYALRASHGGRPGILLKTETSATDLTVDHREELAACMKLETIRMGILTNGRHYEFLWLHSDKKDISVYPLAQVDVKNLSQVYDLLSGFTLEALEAGDAEEQVRRFYLLDRAACALDLKREYLVNEFIEISADIAGDVVREEARVVGERAVDELIKFTRCTDSD